MLPKKNIKILDANIILRFFLKDNEEMANEAERIIDSSSVLLTLEVAAEVVYVLHGVYKQDRSTIADLLKRFISLNNMSVNEYAVLKTGLELYAENNLDFVDCLLCAYNQCYGYEICTFDEKLKKLIDRLNR